jgi:hypothetical protein
LLSFCARTAERSEVLQPGFTPGRPRPTPTQSCIKGTVRVISSDPTCKDYSARFTMVSLKALSDQVWYPCFSFGKLIIFSFGFSLWKWIARFLLQKQWRN